MRGLATTGLPGVKPVTVIHSENVAPREAALIDVHYIESGQSRIERISVGRPVNFDRIVTVSVEDTAPFLSNGRKQDLSIRGLARAAFYGAAAIQANAAQALRFDGPIIDSRAVESNNMAHLLLEVVPCVLHARRILGCQVSLLTERLQAPFRNLLDAFCIPQISVWRNVEANFIKVRGVRGMAVYDLIGYPQCASSVSLSSPYRGVDFASSIGFERVFLARRGIRSLANHDDVERLVRKFGYKTVFMEDYSVRDQLSIGTRANHVVAIHGAAMAFLALNDEIESVVELTPPHVYHDLFPLCLAPPAKQYHLVISEFDQAVIHSGWSAIAYHKSRPFAADLTLLKESLASVH